MGGWSFRKALNQGTTPYYGQLAWLAVRGGKYGTQLASLLAFSKVPVLLIVVLVVAL